MNITIEVPEDVAHQLESIWVISPGGQWRHWLSKPTGLE